MFPTILFWSSTQSLTGTAAKRLKLHREALNLRTSFLQQNQYYQTIGLIEFHALIFGGTARAVWA
jgi:hypothetical protein